MKKFFEENYAYIAIVGVLIVVLLFIPLISYTVSAMPTPNRVLFNEFINMVEDQKVSKVVIDLDNGTFKYFDTENNMYITDNPKEQNFKRYLLDQGITVEEKKSLGFTPAMFVTIGFMLIMIGIMFKMGRGGLNSNINTLSNKVIEETLVIPSTRITNIAGNEEILDEIKTLVEFLKNPQHYKAMGAKLPKGIILYGPPGTGKTLTAKAIAGEAGVPFFSMSGSDFVEVFVGMGSRKVRDLFKKAREKSPCIIFIDELDAVGAKRSAFNNGEQNQTVNALLNELDGFDGSEGIVVIAATNRLEDLDAALIRPGRFDKHLMVNLPDQKARLQILEVYAKNKKLAEDVDLEHLAKLTIGFAGAGLEALLNEAAILAANKHQSVITYEDIDEAYYKTVMKGSKKKSKNEDILHKKIVAWHESGHALCAKLLTDMEIPKVSIVPSTSGAEGVTFITPKKMGLYSRQELLNNVKIRYAGRAAEYILLGKEDSITTGAANDIEQATTHIREIITTYGMHPRFGMLSLKELRVNADAIILEEASKLALQLYDETLQFLASQRDTLEQIANALIEKETLSEEELDQIILEHSSYQKVS